MKTDQRGWAGWLESSRAYAREDSSQPAHLLWSVIICLKKLCILGYPKYTQWRFWSDWGNAQADLNPPGMHMSNGTFSDVTVHLLFHHKYIKWTLPSMNLDKFIISQRCVFTTNKQNGKQGRLWWDDFLTSCLIWMKSGSRLALQRCSDCGVESIIPF